MYTSNEVANYFISKATAEKKGLTPMKLQKLVYFAHGWHLAIYGRPLIDESIEAWKYGPVVPTLYHRFKSYGNSDISKYAIIGVNTISDADTKIVLDLAWELYSELSPIQLSNITHEAGSPWEQTLKEYLDKGRDLPKGKDIDDAIIERFFKNQIDELER